MDGEGGYLFTAKEEGTGRASIPGMIDRVAQKTRKGLKEKPNSGSSFQTIGQKTSAEFIYVKARKPWRREVEKYILALPPEIFAECVNDPPCENVSWSG